MRQLRLPAQLNLQYPDSVRESRITSIVLFWDQPLNDWLDGTITMELLDLSQGSNPIPAGQSVSGNSLGLGLIFHLYRSDPVKLHADLGFQYFDTSGSQDGQNVNMSWTQVSAQLQADIKLVKYSYLYIAVGAVSIDGTEHADGTVNSVLSFSSEQPAYGVLGVKIGVDPTGYIGIEISTGSIAGGQIYFQRWF